MSKIGAYLQEHIDGEVSLSQTVRESVSRDGSVLKAKPEIVVFPKSTNDVRKVARFSWQLAERGNVLPITARGGGSDVSGAAIGSGVVLAMTAHMNRIFEYEARQKLIRLQPGAIASTVSTVLELQGAGIPALPSSQRYSTVGGAVANNATGILSGKYGGMSEWVDRLEVVLASGEVIQTGRISKRELNRKKGLGTLEGEIYRGIDNLIEDNQELITSFIENGPYSNAGYYSIASVKRRDGSIDLTPLFVGSQGTLGIITEMILRADALAPQVSAMVLSFADTDTARDVAETIMREKPAFLEQYDAELFKQSTKLGKSYDFLKEPDFTVKSVLVVGFDDTSERIRRRRIKKVAKALKAVEAWYANAEGDEATSLLSLRGALLWSSSLDGIDFSPVSFLGDVYVPLEGVGIFRTGLKALAKKYDTSLPVFAQPLFDSYRVMPSFNLKKSGNKPKLVKLLDEYATLIDKVNGDFIGAGTEGRLKSRFAWAGYDEETAKLFTGIKAVFDPYAMLNPGVKQDVELKKIAPMIQSDYSFPSLPNHVPSV